DSLTSGFFNKAFVVLDSFSTIDFGVPAGTYRAYQMSTSMSPMPVASVSTLACSRAELKSCARNSNPNRQRYQ
ncbi:MAG: hypothetical protein ACJ8NR_16730, partial [Sulfurifustis sp.]